MSQSNLEFDLMNKDQKTGVFQKKWQQQHPILWKLCCFLGIIMGLVMIFFISLIIYLNTQSGKDYLAAKIGDWTDHSFEVVGVSGRFPNHLKIDELRINKLYPTKKAWLTLKKLRLDWSAVALLYKKIAIKNLTAKELDFDDLPISSTSTQKTNSKPPFIALATSIQYVKVDKLHFSPKITLQNLDLKAQGSAETSNLLSFFYTISLETLPNFHLELQGEELNNATQIKLTTTVNKHQITDGFLTFEAQSNAKGILERLLNTNQLTPLSLKFVFKGRFDQLQTNLNLTTNQTYLKEMGYLNLPRSTLNIRLLGHSPSMTLNQQFHWDSWDLDAQLSGMFKEPVGKGYFNLINFVAKDTIVNKLSINFTSYENENLKQDKSNRYNWSKLHVVIDGLRIPGQYPHLFAKKPILLDAIYFPNLSDQQVDFQLQHDLIKAIGQVFIKPTLHGSIDLVFPRLDELAALKNIDLEGWSALNIAFRIPKQKKDPILFDLDGPIEFKKGLPTLVNMMGKRGHVGIHARIYQNKNLDVLLDQSFLTGQNFLIQGKGTFLDQQIKGIIGLDVNNLSAVFPSLKGQSKTELKANGSLKDLALQLKTKTKFQTSNNKNYAIAPSELKLSADLKHLFSLPKLTLFLEGNLDRSPISLQLEAGQKKDTKNYFVEMKKLNWRSLKGMANFNVSNKNFVPDGNLDLKITRLSDFRNIFHQNIDGKLGLQIHSIINGYNKLLINLDSRITMQNLQFTNLALSGYIENLFKKPNIYLKSQILDLRVPQARGNIRFNALGTLENLKITSNADFPSLIQDKGFLDTVLILDLIKKKVFFQKLNALIKKENIHLVSPVKVDFGNRIAMDHLRLTFAPPKAPFATIDIMGMVKPSLNLNVSVQNITPAIFKPFMPTLQAQGLLSAQAKLKGNFDKPIGTITVHAINVKMLNGDAASLPVAKLSAQANLTGLSAQIRSQIQMNNKLNLDIDGLVPLNSNDRLALNLSGNANLGLSNAIIGAYGQQVKGHVNLAMHINGNYITPIIMGNIQLADGSFRDYAQGISIQKIQAKLIGEKDHIILQSFDAKAGQGNIHAEGDIGIFQPGIPVNILFNMKDARPLISDLLTAVLDGDITVNGMARSRLETKGLIKIKHAEINIPHSIASSVVPLKVIRPGQKIDIENKKNSLGPIIGLDLIIKSAGQILVQGFGLFTDMAGSIHITGTTDEPSMAGGMKMQNGHIDLSGISLDFTRGVIGFNGSNVDRKIDPSLDFEVKKTVEGNTARLLITGFASAPKITLTSSPPLSQDRVLALLLFGVDSQSLSATQMAEIGLALATLGGQSAGIDPLGTVRKSLGLDRLSLGGGNRTSGNGGSNNGASVAAGKYVAKGVYLGAKQSTGNAGTQAEMQIDITKHLKATAAVGTGKDNSRFVTPDNDPGSNVGLIYEFDY